MSLSLLPHFPAAPGNIVQSVQLLDEDACEDWVLRVMLLKRHWRQRHPQAPFYTLGMAAYLDGIPLDGKAAYHELNLRERSNQLLVQHFGPLLELVCLALQKQLGLPVNLAQDAALPGFHIYLPHPAFALPVAKVHQDLQYLNAFPHLRPRNEDLLTFTLPLSTPDGSGLLLWTGSADVPEFYSYHSGQLVWHDGLTLHQAVLKCSDGLERITLQGHALRGDNNLKLYW